MCAAGVLPGTLQRTWTADARVKRNEENGRWSQDGADPAPGTPDEFAKIMQEEQARVKRIIKDIGLKPQF